jgi:peroxiredoxin/uncharacterized membrane protein YphA (DoxX/SURF4 family)
MGWLLLAARVALSFVFAVAGLAKLRDLEGSRKAVRDFGLPSGFAKPIGIGLPLVEITVACLLLPVGSAWIGAAGALLLLLAFIAAIAINMGLGRRPKCHCFGQVHSETIGWPTLARNGVLALLAALLLLQARTNPGPSIVLIARGLTAGQVVRGTLVLLLASAIASLFWLVLHLFRQNGRLLLRIEALEQNRPSNRNQAVVPHGQAGLPVGTKAASFDLPLIGGGRATLEGFLQEGRPLLLISTDQNCGPCTALMPEIATWQRDRASELTIALLSHGKGRDIHAKAREQGMTNLLVDDDRRIAKQYQIVGTPTAVLILSDGSIGSNVLGGADQIRGFIEDNVAAKIALARPEHARNAAFVTAMFGRVGPAFTLTDLSGDIVSSSQFNGNGTLLLFWNPACGFCQQMLPKLKDWEQARPSDAPQLVLVSSGSREANLGMDLEATVLIDEKFSVGQSYGAAGTPSGVLLDSAGRIASGLAVGAVALMELLSDTQLSGASATRGARG